MKKQYYPWYKNIYCQLYKAGCGLNILSKGYNIRKIWQAIKSLKS